MLDLVIIDIAQIACVDPQVIHRIIVVIEGRTPRIEVVRRLVVKQIRHRKGYRFSRG